MSDETVVKAARPSFFDTTHCTSRIHCKACRTDKTFRQSIATAFATGNGDEFDCPHGLVAANFEDGKFPPLVQEARNLAKSMVKVATAAVKGEPILVTEEERNRRLEICRGTDTVKACDLYDVRGRCRQCGCRMDIKATLQRLKCPIGKW
jgi:hypothetical protein